MNTRKSQRRKRGGSGSKTNKGKTIKKRSLLETFDSKRPGIQYSDFVLGKDGTFGMLDIFGLFS
jgi:hypothetical protein